MSLDGMSAEARAAWERLNKSYGKPLSINSAYRSPEKNAAVGGAKKSQHMHGNAFDVNVRDLNEQQRLDLIGQAQQAGFRGIGVYNNALHFDVGASRAWGSDYTKNTIPDWAKGAVGAPLAPSGGQPTQNALAGPQGGIPMAPMQQLTQQQPQQQQAQQQQEQGPPVVHNMLRASDFQTVNVPYQVQRFT